MWYTLGYANTIIYTPAHGGRAGKPGDRTPVLVRLYGTSVPNPPRQCRGPIDHHDCARPALHRSDGAQRPSCVPPARSHRAAAPLVTPAHDRDDLRRWAPASPCARCCTRVPGPSASPPAAGRLPSPPRSVSPRGSPRGWSATKPFGWPSAAWGWPGSAPNIGSPVPIRRMPEKKTARPADPAGHDPSDVGARL